MSAQKDKKNLFKVVFLGERGTGATNIISRYTQGTFYEDHITTIEMDFTVKKLTVNGVVLQLQLWGLPRICSH